MRYGEKLRECRVARGWSRKHLENVIFSRFREQNTGITEDGIKSIEYGVSVLPYETTRAMLRRVFPELGDWERENTITYQGELSKGIPQRV